MLLIERFFIASLLLMLNMVGISACQTVKRDQGTVIKRPTKESAPTSTPTNKGNEMSKDIKILAEGGQSRVDNAFIIVARDSSVYSRLRELISKLPELDAGFFRENAVVGTFLGTRPTGGFGVNITGEAGSIKIRERIPPGDAMVTQVITSPFKVVSVPVADGNRLSLDVGSPWQNKASKYNVSGDATYTGGIAGRTIKRNIDGDVSLIRYREFVTLLFTLRAYADNERVQAVADSATGIVQSSSQISIPQFNAGLLTEPDSRLKATGTLGEKEISLTFESLPNNIADGFNVKGSLKSSK
jgi:hypothetical protein